jgi:hypothetical protein
LARNHVLTKKKWMYGYYSPKGLNQDKTHRVLILRLIFYRRISTILSKISDDDMSIEACLEGGSVQDPSRWLIASWTFIIKFPYDTQFIFESLMFAVREDGNLELLTRGPILRHPAPVYEKSPYYPADPSTSGRACSGLNPYTRMYYLSVMTSQGLLIRTPIFQRWVG